MPLRNYQEREVSLEDYKDSSPAKVNYYVKRYTTLHKKGEGRTAKQEVRIRQIRQILIVNGKRFDDKGNMIGMLLPKPIDNNEVNGQINQSRNAKSPNRPSLITPADSIVKVGDQFKPGHLPASTVKSLYHKVTGRHMPTGWRFYDSLDLSLLLEEPDHNLTQILGETISPFAEETEFIIYVEGNFITLSESQIMRKYPGML